MELFKYIVKFIYRIRWWMVIFPCIAGIIAWFLTRSLEKTYDVKTTIFTGIISGYNVDATDTRNATVHMSNLMNIITTERTLKIVSLKLLARCLVYGDAERNTSYISAIHYQQLVSGIPRELQALIDKQNEEKTYHNLVAFERPSINNFIYQLLNYTHPYFSVPLLSQHIKVARLGNSDMIEIAYSANDPGIAYNTLEILNEEFVKQYHELRYGETDNVIKFFQEELARLGKMLTAAEDSLIEYNIENRIINYGEQTKQVASTGMLPFENEVADYVHSTGNPCMYRVTPFFKGDELVARGVEMEAESVKDQKIFFHVFVYNIQPGIEIDYTTGNSWEE